MIALGGGAFVQSRNVEALVAHAAVTVFLDTSVEEMLQRCETEAAHDAENPRPLAADREAFVRLYEERLPFYRTASVTIATAGKDVAKIATEIAEKLGLKPRK